MKSSFQRPKEEVEIEDKLKEIYHPICAFITFTNQEAKERAVQYLCKKNSL